VKAKNFFWRAFGFLFHATLAMMLIDWAVPELFWKGLISPYEILFVLMGCAFAGYFLLNGKNMIRQIIQVLAASKWQILCLCGYLMMGVITLFYAQSVGYATSKYIVVVQMLFFWVCAFVYVAEKRVCGGNALLEIYANIGIAAVISAFLGYYGFFSGTKTIYLDRITPNSDYNQYTTILLIGLVCGVFWLLSLKTRKSIRYLAIGALCSVLIPAIYIAGSRRSYLLMLAVISLLTAYLVILEIYGYIKRKDFRQFVAGVGCLVVCAVCIVLSMELLDIGVKVTADKRMQQITMAETATQSTEETNLDGTAPSVGETSKETVPDTGDSSKETVPDVIVPSSDLSETYQTISSGTALSKRMLIWSAAWDKIATSEVYRLIVGYGASYSSDLYDDLSNPKVQMIHSAYGYNENDKAKDHWMNTHNLFLQDILEGGIILFSIQLLLILLAAVYTVKLLLREPLHGVTLGILYGILLATLFLSSDRGMISNKFFWLIMMMQILAWCALPHKVRK